jgi:hypothetical protein
MKHSLIVWLATWLLNGSLLHAQACECVPLSPEAARDSADIIVEGTCIQVNSNWISGGMKYSFEVDRCWKKATDRFFIVNTPFAKDCGVAFEEGQRYLLYVRRIFTPKTNRCMGTKPREDAEADLLVLGEAMSPRRSNLIQPMYWAVGGLGLLSLLVLAFIVLHKRSSRGRSA